MKENWYKSEFVKKDEIVNFEKHEEFGDLEGDENRKY